MEGEGESRAVNLTRRAFAALLASPLATPIIERIEKRRRMSELADWIARKALRDEILHRLLYAHGWSVCGYEDPEKCPAFVGAHEWAPLPDDAKCSMAVWNGAEWETGAEWVRVKNG